MSNIKEILSKIQHRPYEIPQKTWVYYQEWNRALFLHWKIPVEILQELIPAQLTLDTFEGNAFVSLVAFSMEKIRPRCLPALNFVSNFEEVNLRTYINYKNKKGVYFLNIEAAKKLSVFIAKNISGLPYEKAQIKRSESNFSVQNFKKGFYLEANFEIKEEIKYKTALDHWLTERYCLYLETNKKLFRYDTHHEEWKIKNVAIKSLKLNYKIQKLQLSQQPDFVHYSEGVQVLAWSRERI